MPRIFLDSSLQGVSVEDLKSYVEKVFQQLEDQINSGTNITSLSDTQQTLPQGMLTGDLIVNLQNGELRIGMFNGVEVVYSSFGSFVGAITDSQHGTRSGGNLHPIATQTVAGFMSAADKLEADHHLPESSGPGMATVLEYPNDGNWGFYTDTVGSLYYLVKNKSGVIYSTLLT